MKSFDYVIVGGGTAACVLANRLSASGRHSVLLLEAGGEPNGIWIPIPAGFSKLLTNPKFNWRLQTEPEPHTHGRAIPVPSGKGLGGSSLINGMIYVRGQPEDFDAWQTAGWSAKDVAPYFQKLENYARGDSTRGKQGPLDLVQVGERFPIAQAFLDAAQQDGHDLNEDYNSGNQAGFGYYQVNQRNGRRWSAYDAYLKPARQRKNLVTETQAQVQRVVLDGKRCTGVQYRQHGREMAATANIEVIMAAGALRTPQLLELSGIGQPALLQSLGQPLRHALPGVGANYLDHFCTRLNWRVKNTVTLNEMSRGWRLAMALAQYALRGTGILTLGTGLVHGFVRTRPQLATPDAQYFFMHASYANAAERILDRAPGMTIGVTQLRPESVGSIHIKSLDPAASPAIRPNFLDRSVDQDCLVRSMQIARRIVGQPALRDFVAHEMNPGPAVQEPAAWLEFARATGQTIYHPLGTCRMGEDQQAVVDCRLKVRGLAGLRVVDASVIPKMVSGNIHATVLMVAEKAADMILEEAPR